MAALSINPNGHPAQRMDAAIFPQMKAYRLNGITENTGMEIENAFSVEETQLTEIQIIVLFKNISNRNW